MRKVTRSGYVVHADQMLQHTLRRAQPGRAVQRRDWAKAIVARLAAYLLLMGFTMLLLAGVAGLAWVVLWLAGSRP